MATPAWIDTKVCLDDIGPFPAQVIPGRRWNGWLCPRFTWKTTEQISQRLQASDPEDAQFARGRFEWIGDVLLEHNIDIGAPEMHLPDEDGMYHLGSFSWVWSMAWDWEGNRRAMRGDIAVEIKAPDLYIDENGKVGEPGDLAPGPWTQAAKGYGDLFYKHVRISHEAMDLDAAFRHGELLALHEREVPLDVRRRAAHRPGGEGSPPHD